MTVITIFLVLVAVVLAQMIFLIFYNLNRARKFRQQRKILDETLIASEKRVRDLFKELELARRELGESMKRINEKKDDKPT